MLTQTQNNISRRYSRAEKSILLWRKKYARREQLAPLADYRVFFYMAGRGAGKTRAAAEDVKAFGLLKPRSRIAVAAPTFSDARDICFEGESGILSVLPANSIRNWNRSIGELYLTNGSYYRIITGDRPAQARGPQWHRAWADEIAEWRRPETFWNLMLGLRLGSDPRAIVTGTPKPVKVVRDLVASPDTYLSRGTTYDNRANLPKNVFREIAERYEGTMLGRQEIYGELLLEMPGTLFPSAIIEEHRIRVEDAPTIEDLQEVVVAVDPEGTEEGDSETGIVVAGRIGDHVYILSDASDHMSPNGWGQRVVDSYDGWEADYVIAETNQGGAMVKYVISSKDPDIPIRTVHAKRGKVLRADPVVAKYEQGRVHHVGLLAKLETQMSAFTRTEQPLGTDRCLAAGTLIDTLNGPTLIECVKPGDFVRTRKGYRRVLAAGLTSPDAPLLRVEFSDGRELIGTGNHPVFVLQKGFVNLDALCYADTVWTMDFTKRLSTSKVGDTCVGPNIVEGTCGSIFGLRGSGITCHYTAGSTRSITARFRRVTSCTIGMAIRSTIIPRISLPLAAKNTQRNILGTQSAMSGNESISTRSGKRLSNGIVPKKAAPGIGNTASSLGKVEKNTSIHAKYAANRIEAAPALSREADSVRARALCVITGELAPTTRSASARCAVNRSPSISTRGPAPAPLSVARLSAAGKGPVYNLTVEGEREYFANGVLVHNCDALVYAVTYLLLKGAGRKKRMLKGGYK